MSLYPKPLFILHPTEQENGVEKKTPSKAKPGESARNMNQSRLPFSTPQPKKLLELKGQVSKTPGPRRPSADRRPSMPASEQKRYPVTPGVGQRQNIHRAQQLMQQYDTSRKSRPSLHPAITPSQQKTSQRFRSTQEGESASQATALIPKATPRDVESDGAETPDDEFYDVPVDFDFKHDTPAKAYRRNLRDQAKAASPSTKSTQNLVQQELNKIKARLTMGDISGAHTLCTLLFEMRQQDIFRNAEYYVVAAAISAKMHNFPKAISLYNSAIRVMADPPEVLKQGLEKLQISAPTLEIKLEMQELSSRICLTKSTPKLVSSRLQEFRQRTNQSLMQSPMSSSTSNAPDVNEIKLYSTLLASSLERQKVIDRMATPAMPSTPRDRSRMVPRQFDFGDVEETQAVGANPVLEISPELAVEEVKHTSSTGAGTINEEEHHEQAPDELAHDEPITEGLVCAPATPEEIISYPRTIFSAETPETPVMLPGVLALKKNHSLVSSPYFKSFKPSRIAMPVVNDRAASGINMTPVIPCPLSPENINTLWRDEEEEERVEQEDSIPQQEVLPQASVALSQEAVGEPQESASDKKSEGRLIDWIEGHQTQDNLGRYETLTIVRSKRSNKKPQAANMTPAKPASVIPVQVGSQVQLIVDDLEPSQVEDEVNLLTPVRRSARLNKEVVSASKPKMLIFRSNPNIKN